MNWPKMLFRDHGRSGPDAAEMQGVVRAARVVDLLAEGIGSDLAAALRTHTDAIRQICDDYEKLGVIEDR